MSLDGRLTPVAELSAADRGAMLQLMQRHYENICPTRFAADLDDKQWAIQVVNAQTGELCGFSTQRILDAEVEGRALKILFSGDTIVDERFRGDQALMRVWGRFALTLIDEFAQGELYWFLISQGYKTYRFLPVFFHAFFPRHELPTPARMRQVLDVLGQQRYGRAYDRDRGVIRAQADQYYLRDGVADVSPERLRDPHVRFFIERNPHWARGDELCCLAPLSRENFTRAAYRVIGSRA